MLNQVSQAHSDFSGGTPPPGVRFIDIGVTIVNQPNNPIRTWVINDGINPVVTVRSPDVGLLLNPHPPSPPPTVIPRAFFANLFKIPTLWGIKDTAPYFHDNGAKTLRDAVAHYQRFFNFTEAQDPVGFAIPGRFDRADRRRRGRHRRVPQASGSEPIGKQHRRPDASGDT